MARETKGSFGKRTLADGTQRFRIRFQFNGRRETLILHERNSCPCGCGGGWDEISARTEMGNTLARVRAGVWSRPEPPASLTEFGEDDGTPLFGEYSKYWLDQKVAGVIGDRPISKNTRSDYKNRLRHLEAYFGRYPLDQIDAELCVAFKAQLLMGAQEQRDALEAGADLRDPQGRTIRPLGASMIHQIIACLKAIMDEAVEDGYIAVNPASGRRMKIRVPKPKRTFLEMEELAFLIDAASDQDSAMLVGPAPDGVGESARAIARLAAKGLSVTQISEETGFVKSNVTYHLRNLGAEIGHGYVGRKVVCAVLGYGGPRVSELCAMKIGDVRVHNAESARFRIPDAKTEAGERWVEMSPDLAEVVIEHIDRLRRLGKPVGPGDYLVPNLRGGQMTRQGIRKILIKAAALASERLVAKGLPPLPNTTPHTMRRTYISIALIANEFDVKYVMAQVGHADSTMTMDVYAQLETRFKRSHGESFDRLVRGARDLVKNLPDPGAEASTAEVLPSRGP